MTGGYSRAMNTYDCIPQFSKMLKNLDAWLVKATEHAKTKKFEVDVLANARLAPDQYTLVKQVQAACDSAKFAAARLAGKEAPKHPDTEQTMDELRARVATCKAYVETITKADFAGAADRAIALPFLEGKTILGTDYVNEMVLPNFYFHLTTAYAILRHNGVALGKMDFIGSLKLQG